MGLSRKRQRELKRLKRSAPKSSGTSSAKPSSTRARFCAMRAARPRTTRAKKSGPRVRDAYEDQVRPAFATGVRAGRDARHRGARERLSDDVLPAISGALGSALAMLEAAKDPRVREVVRRVSGAGQRAGIVEAPASPRGPAATS